jgi:large subunit ribosomal protein L14e
VCVVWLQVKRNETIEIGRVVSINYGPQAGKIATIIDIVDQARALIDGPFSVTGVKRQTIPVRNLSITAITVPISRGVREGVLKRKVQSSKVLEQWQSSNWARKQSRHAQRTKLTDFQRFQLMMLRKQKSKLVGLEYAKLRRDSAKQKK